MYCNISLNISLSRWLVINRVMKYSLYDWVHKAIYSAQQPRNMITCNTISSKYCTRMAYFLVKMRAKKKYDLLYNSYNSARTQFLMCNLIAELERSLPRTFHVHNKFIKFFFHLCSNLVNRTTSKYTSEKINNSVSSEQYYVIDVWKNIIIRFFKNKCSSALFKKKFVFR